MRLRESGDYYTIPEVAKIFRMHNATIRRHVKNKKVPSVRIGGAIRIPAAWVREKFMEGGWR